MSEKKMVIIFEEFDFLFNLANLAIEHAPLSNFDNTNKKEYEDKLLDLEDKGIGCGVWKKESD